MEGGLVGAVALVLLAAGPRSSACAHRHAGVQALLLGQAEGEREREPSVHEDVDAPPSLLPLEGGDDHRTCTLQI